MTKDTLQNKDLYEIFQVLNAFSINIPFSSDKPSFFPWLISMVISIQSAQSSSGWEIILPSIIRTFFISLEGLDY